MARIGSRLNTDSASVINAKFNDNPRPDADGVLFYRQKNNSPAFIKRVSANDYILGHLLDSGEWVEVNVASLVVGAHTTHLIKEIKKVAYTYFTSVDDDDASVVYTGTGWGQVSAPGGYGDDWQRTNAAGAFYTITTPSCTAVEIRYWGTTNNGYGKVTINNGASVAELLPTAAEEIAAGRLPSTVLISNGGTLNPTDRLLNFHLPSGVPDSRVCISRNLTLGVHTVKVEVTGYKVSGSSDTRIGISGYSYSTRTDLPISPTTDTIVVKSYSSWPIANSALEYAYTIRINAVDEWAGTVHGYEVSTLSVTKDNAVVTMADNEIIFGKNIKLIKTADLFHPQSLVTEIGTANTVYEPGPHGLRCYVDLNFTADGQVMTGYPGMLPVRNQLSTATFIGTNSAITVTANNDNGDNAYVGTRFAALLDGIGVVHESEAVTFKNGLHTGTGNRAWFEDRTGGSLNKCYFTTHQPVGAETMPAKVHAQFRYIVW